MDKANWPAPTTPMLWHMEPIPKAELERAKHARSLSPLARPDVADWRLGATEFGQLTSQQINEELAALNERALRRSLAYNAKYGNNGD